MIVNNFRKIAHTTLIFLTCFTFIFFVSSRGELTKPSSPMIEREITLIEDPENVEKGTVIAENGSLNLENGKGVEKRTEDAEIRVNEELDQNVAEKNTGSTENWELENAKEINIKEGFGIEETLSEDDINSERKHRHIIDEVEVENKDNENENKNLDVIQVPAKSSQLGGKDWERNGDGMDEAPTLIPLPHPIPTPLSISTSSSSSQTISPSSLSSNSSILLHRINQNLSPSSSKSSPTTLNILPPISNPRDQRDSTLLSILSTYDFSRQTSYPFSRRNSNPEFSSTQNNYGTIPIRNRNSRRKGKFLNIFGSTPQFGSHPIPKKEWYRNGNHRGTWRAHFYDQAIAIVFADDKGVMRNCTILEVIEKWEQEAAMEYLGDVMPLHPMSLFEMVEMNTICGKLNTPSTEEPTYYTQAPGEFNWLYGLSAFIGILPGTYWCGRQDKARDYHQLGSHTALDSCCRTHDHCPVKVLPFTDRYTINNVMGFATRLHCLCETAFYRCLKDIRVDPLAEFVGFIYFNNFASVCMERPPPKSPGYSRQNPSPNSASAHRNARLHSAPQNTHPTLDPAPPREDIVNQRCEMSINGECRKWDLESITRDIYALKRINLRF